MLPDITEQTESSTQIKHPFNINIELLKESLYPTGLIPAVGVEYIHFMFSKDSNLLFSSSKAKTEQVTGYVRHTPGQFSLLRTAHLSYSGRGSTEGAGSLGTASPADLCSVLWEGWRNLCTWNTSI